MLEHGKLNSPTPEHRRLERRAVGTLSGERDPGEAGEAGEAAEAAEPGATGFLTLDHEAGLRSVSRGHYEDDHRRRKAGQQWPHRDGLPVSEQGGE